MMSTMRTSGRLWKSLVVAPAVLIGLNSMAHAEEFTGRECWYYERAWEYPIGEDHIFVGGPVKGVFINDAGEGSFMHNAATVCSWSFDYNFKVEPAVYFGTGHCVYTDGDGGRVVLQWTEDSEKFEWFWTSGTGKYEGISGSGTTENVAFATHNAGEYSGCNVVNGTWEAR